MPERRVTNRQRTLKGGTIYCDGFAGIECIIRNLTKSGACLEIKGPNSVPDEFFLIIKPEHLKRSCTVIWRSEGRIGVRF